MRPSLPFVLVLPFFNEVDVAEEVVRSSCAWVEKRFPKGRVLGVDDGSTDGTTGVLRALSEELPVFECLCHAQNLGYGAALATGLNHSPAEWLATMDADGQFQAEDLERLWEMRHQGCLVKGIRVHRADPRIRSLMAYLYEWLVTIVLGLRLKDPDCGMKLIRGDVWGRVQPGFGQGALFSAELFLNARLAGLTWCSVPVPHYPRLHGAPTGNSIRVILKMFRELWNLKRSSRSRGTQKC